MSMKLDAGVVGRKDLFQIFPENLVMGDNSRSVPYTPEQLQALADSIETYGQQTPCVGRRITGNKVALVSGFSRTAAVALLNIKRAAENKELLKVDVRVLDLNAEEAFVRSIVENIDRNETTPIDDAYAQRRLREDFGWTETRIAEFYKKTVSQISQLRKVLQLSEPLKQEVIAGNMPITTAIMVADIPEPQRAAVVEAAKDTTGKVVAEVVAKAVRAAKISAGGKTGRSIKELKTFFEGLTGPAEKANLQGFASDMIAYISGSITDAAMTEALKDRLG